LNILDKKNSLQRGHGSGWGIFSKEVATNGDFGSFKSYFFLKEALGDLYLNGKIPGSGPNQLCQLQLAQNIGKIRKKKKSIHCT
jgi:hypothetical protein